MLGQEVFIWSDSTGTFCWHHSFMTCYVGGADHNEHGTLLGDSRLGHPHQWIKGSLTTYTDRVGFQQKYQSSDSPSSWASLLHSYSSVPSSYSPWLQHVQDCWILFLFWCISFIVLLLTGLGWVWCISSQKVYCYALNCSGQFSVHSCLNILLALVLQVWIGKPRSPISFLVLLKSQLGQTTPLPFLILLLSKKTTWCVRLIHSLG